MFFPFSHLWNHDCPAAVTKTAIKMLIKDDYGIGIYVKAVEILPTATELSIDNP